MVERYRENPSEVFWDSALGKALWQVPKFDMSRPLYSLLELDPGDVKRSQMEDWCRNKPRSLYEAMGTPSTIAVGRDSRKQSGTRLNEQV